VQVLGVTLTADLGQLVIQKLIIHEVPQHRRSDASTSPIFSEIESPLDDELRLFFREKMIQTVGSTSAYEVAFMNGSTSPIPALVVSYLAGTGISFLDMSKTMAQHLHNCQSGINPGGLVCIVDCQSNERKSLGILKLEKESGVRLGQTTIDGKQTFDVRMVRDLILTKKTKLFKIGYFFVPDEGEPPGPGEPRGVVSDQQLGYLPDREIANFFLTQFLGCVLLEDPRSATKHFFNAAEDFINEKIEDPVQRNKAITHLLSELTSHRSRINIRQFARDYLPTALGTEFENCMAEKGIRGTTIEKNNELIEDQLDRIAIEFQNDLAIVGSRESVQKNVRIHRTDGPEARVEIKGRLKRIGTK